MKSLQQQKRNMQTLLSKLNHLIWLFRQMKTLMTKAAWQIIYLVDNCMRITKSLCQQLLKTMQTLILQNNSFGFHHPSQVPTQKRARKPNIICNPVKNERKRSLLLKNYERIKICNKTTVYSPNSIIKFLRFDPSIGF